MTPRPYLSYSQLMLFERSPDKYREVYFDNAPGFVNDAMRFGADVADSLEGGGATGDAMTDLVLSHFPKLDIPEHLISADIRVGREMVPVIAKLDSAKEDLTEILEYKTGAGKWTQGKVDKADQLTFYAMVIWLKTRKIPKMTLIWAKTDGTNGGTSFSGHIEKFETTRHMGEILRMMERCRKAWQAIERMSEEILL